LDRLTDQPLAGYHAAAPIATEPTALAALALVAHDRADAASAALDWLAEHQNSDGSLGVSQHQREPRWPTSLAVLAWNAAGRHEDAVAAAVNWILSERGRTYEDQPYVGHDASIPSWSWVENTHCWVEPTAMHVLALKAVGRPSHQRTRDGVRMLKDRLLPGGGCNYGNTVVLGQTLRPHLMPTGWALLALAGEKDDDGRIRRSLDFVQRSASRGTATASLCLGLLGLAAHQCTHPTAVNLLSVAAARVFHGDPSPYKLALLALAAAGADSPLVSLSQEALAS
jgi:hypothetical protein